MHVPQVRLVRHDRDPRHNVRPGSEHHQREDLCGAVVLVHHPCHSHVPLSHLRPRGHLGAQHAEDHGREEREI